MPTSEKLELSGWYGRAGKVWYPSTTTPQSINSNGSINHIISSPTLNNSTSSSGNKYTTVLVLKTPNTADIGSISSITISWYQARVYSYSGAVYGTISKNNPINWSTSTDTVATYQGQAVSNTSEQSVTTTSTGYVEASMTFTGSFSKNTTYYLILYTKDTNHQYQVNPNSSSRPIRFKFEYSYTTYTVSYSNGGYGTAPSSHSKTYGVDLELKAFIGNQNVNSHIVKFNANGGTSTPDNITSKITKIQQNWKDTDGETYVSQGSYTKDKAMTMTATWNSGAQQPVTLPDAISKDFSENKYTISYNANNPNTDSITSTTPSSQSLTRTTTYSFKKWAEGSDTSTTIYDAGASYTPNAEVTMYATWNTNATTGSINLASKMTKGDTTANGYKVTLNPNGGICNKASLTAVNTIKWSFNNWNTAADGSGTSYSAESNYDKDSEATMYAQWSNAIKTYGLVDLPTPTRVGYKFVGWAESADATSGVTGSYQPKKTITLYAIWEPDGGVRIYLKEYNGYKIALVYAYIDGTWRLTIPYIYDETSSSWKILGG